MTIIQNRKPQQFHEISVQGYNAAMFTSVQGYDVYEYNAVKVS